MQLKPFSFILLVFIACSFAFDQGKKRIIFFGDSITELGIKPNGYITKLQELLRQKHLDNQYELMGSGISGNKIYDLYLRMEEDVLAKKPDVVVIWIGVNDVWHKSLLGSGTDANKFEKFYNAIIKKLQQNNISVLLCTPAVIGEKTDHTNELDGDLNKYASLIRQIARQNNCPIIDLRKEFIDYNLIHNKDNKESGILTYDRVHLNDKGNELVAQKMFTILHQTIFNKVQ